MYRTQEGSIKTVKVIAHAVLGLIALIALLSSFGVVDAGERGVKVRLGNVKGVVEPGIFVKIPFLDEVRIVDIRTQTVIYERENPLMSASADLQDVKVASVTNYHVDPAKVVDIYLRYRDLYSFEENVIRPAVRDSVKASASKFTAGELVTKRAEFSDMVARTLNDKLSEGFVVVEQSNITNLEFSPSFSAAIEAKVTAQQNAEAAKNKLEQVKFEAQQKIETAKAEAEAIKIQAQAINSQGGADYVQLQAVAKWDGRLPTQMVPGSAVPFINLSN